MATNDKPIHLGKASQDITVTLFQDHLDGLCTLIHFCDGLKASGGGEVPGSFELMMHYRELKSKVGNSMTDYIKPGNCKKGYLYRVSSRNLDKAVFDGDNGFIGIREKLGSRYLFKEYHKDTDRNFGTVLPLEELKKVPSSIPITSQLLHEDGNLWGQKDGMWVPVISRSLKEGEVPHGQRQGFVDLWADTGERLGDKEYPKIRGNEKLMKWLEKQ